LNEIPFMNAVIFDASHWGSLVHWVVPFVGAVACGVAYLVGRNLLIGKPTPVDPDGPLDDNFLHGVTRDRRAAPRRKGNTVEIEILVADEESIPGWVLDRAIGGLGILVDHMIPPGTKVKLRPRATGDTIPWTDVTVRTCRREGIQYEIGVQFHRTPNYSLLLQFG
jgi:hypothetical protein